MEDRPYQTQVEADARKAIRQGKRRLLLVVPTGGGKTVIAARVTRLGVAKGSKVLLLAHRRELITQAAAKLERFGIPHGLIMAGLEHNDVHPVQVASIPTLWHRGILSEKIELPQADIVFIDEAHRSLANTYLKLIEQYPNAVIIGLTATPIRGDGRGLGNVYEAMVEGPSIATLTEQGYLVPVRYYAPALPDLKGVHVKGGDYVEGELQEAMDKPQLVGDIVENWGRIANGRPTFVFASGVQHSLHLQRAFVEAGVKAVHVDGSTSTEDRDAAFAGLADGSVTVLCNCMVATEGTDCPPVSCVVLARPTKHIGLYFQMSGRGLRPSPETGKKDCILIDHSGAVYAHGRLDEPVSWSLDVTERIQDRQARVVKERKPITCQKCKAVYQGKPCCPECGHIQERFGKKVDVKEGTLLEVGRDGQTQELPIEDAYKVRFYSELLGYCAAKNKKPGFAYHTFQKKFGHKPPWGVPAAEPGPEVSAYAKSQMIRYWKSKKRKP